MEHARRRTLAASLLALSFGLLHDPHVSAAEVTWNFTGAIVNTWGTIGTTPASAFAGAPIVGSVRFDPGVEDGAPGEPQAGLYSQPVPPHEFELRIGGAEFAVPTAFFIGIGNDSTFLSGADSLNVTAAVAFPYPGVPDLWIHYYSIFLVDSSGTVFSNDALPSAPPALAGFDPGLSSVDMKGCTSAHFDGSSCTAQDYSLEGRLDTLTLPEPAAGTGTVTILCLMSLAARRGCARPRR